MVRGVKIVISIRAFISLRHLDMDFECESGSEGAIEIGYIFRSKLRCKVFIMILSIIQVKSIVFIIKTGFRDPSGKH